MLSTNQFLIRMYRYAAGDKKQVYVGVVVVVFVFSHQVYVFERADFARFTHAFALTFSFWFNTQLLPMAD